MDSRKTYMKDRKKFSKFKKYVNSEELKSTIDRSHVILSAISDLPKVQSNSNAAGYSPEKLNGIPALLKPTK